MKVWKETFFTRFPTKQTNPTVPFIISYQTQETPTQRKREEWKRNLGKMTVPNQITLWLWKIVERNVQRIKLKGEEEEDRNRGSFVSSRRRRKRKWEKAVRVRELTRFVGLCLLLFGWLQSETELTNRAAICKDANVQNPFIFNSSMYSIVVNIFLQDKIAFIYNYNL